MNIKNINLHLTWKKSCSWKEKHLWIFFKSLKNLILWFQAVAGLIADARQLAENARSEAASYRSQYGNPIPLKYLNDRVSMYIHAYTLYSAVRPFGSSLIIGTYDPDDGPQMYMIDPSGISYVRDDIINLNFYLKQWFVLPKRTWGFYWDRAQNSTLWIFIQYSNGVLRNLIVM